MLYAVAILLLGGAVISLLHRYRRVLEREVTQRTADLKDSEERYRYPSRRWARALW
jgi:hypothetical protein